jgi:hypothetical protein
VLHRGRQLDDQKIVRRVEIVLAGLVDDPEKAASFCRLVSQNLIELPKLQVLAPFIPDADDEMGVLVVGGHGT